MNEIRINYYKLLTFVEDIFIKCGCKQENARIIAEVLTEAELRGIPSHGIVRIPEYLDMYYKGKIKLNPEIKILKETNTTVTIDADCGYGMIAAKKAMEITIDKAKKNYICQTVVINSTHFGIAGYYSLMAAKKKMIGICGTNANPIVCPTFGVERMLGTNPIAVAIPAKSYQPFVADFATTPVARGKIDLYERENKKIPKGWIVDKYGNDTDNPSALKEGGCLLPLGSYYELANYKGYCLSAIIDIFSGVLGGANFGPFVPSQIEYIKNSRAPVGKGIGHFFIAIRIDAFRCESEFLDDMDLWIYTFKNTKHADNKPQVLIPGEPEYINTINNLKNGIPIKKETINKLLPYINKLNVENIFDI
ncbi:MAG: Ldh family oxidoreductase [Bacteroidales bacterium]|nr:Ldh family oxidoreductase [Bacteroidales bacterium]